MDQVRAQQNDTVDLICHRYYGTTKNVVEAVYQQNPGLADLGPILPHGQRVKMPPITVAEPVTPTVSLWT